MVNTVQGIMQQYGMGDTAQKSSGSDLDKDAFLNLLVTQMQYQDPLKPQTDQQFIAQMAQFSSLEQMQNLNSSSEMSQAYNLIGKVVQATVTNEVTQETSIVEGFVDGVKYLDGDTYLVINDNDVLLSDVEVVGYVDYDTETIMAIEDITETLKEIKETLNTLTGETGTEGTETDGTGTDSAGTDGTQNSSTETP